MSCAVQRKDRTVMNRSMALKKEENKFYDKLEKQFKEMAIKDETLVMKPSREEIIQHIDNASTDGINLTESRY